MVHGKELRQFDALYAEVEIASPENLSSILLGLGKHFFPVNALSKQKHTMRRGMIKPHVLKVRRYTNCLIEINEYLTVFSE